MSLEIEGKTKFGKQATDRIEVFGEDIDFANGVNSSNFTLLEDRNLAKTSGSANAGNGIVASGAPDRVILNKNLLSYRRAFLTFTTDHNIESTVFDEGGSSNSSCNFYDRFNSTSNSQQTLGTSGNAGDEGFSGEDSWLFGGGQLFDVIELQIVIDIDEDTLTFVTHNLRGPTWSTSLSSETSSEWNGSVSISTNFSTGATFTKPSSWDGIFFGMNGSSDSQSTTYRIHNLVLLK